MKKITHQYLKLVTRTNVCQLAESEATIG